MEKQIGDVKAIADDLRRLAAKLEGCRTFIDITLDSDALVHLAGELKAEVLVDEIRSNGVLRICSRFTADLSGDFVVAADAVKEGRRE